MNNEPIGLRRRWLKRKYGLTLDKFYNMYSRQNGKCLCCQETVEALDLNVDHCHKTGVVRGLLCANCNTVLGRVKEKDDILYRMSAYLSRDPSKILVYVVGSLRNEEVKKVSAVLRSNNSLDVFDDYMAAGPEADDYWKKYENDRGRGYKEALNGRSAKHVFYYDQAFLSLADAVVVVLPAGKSCMIEAGFAAACNKPVIFLRDSEDGRYDVMKKFATSMVDTVDEVESLIMEYCSKYL